MIIVIPQIINFKIGKFNTILQTEAIWGLQRITYALIGNINIKILLEFYVTASKTNNRC